MGSLHAEVLFSHLDALLIQCKGMGFDGMVLLDTSQCSLESAQGLAAGKPSVVKSLQMY